MARRVGCALGAIVLLFAAGLTGLVWLLLSATGAVGSAPVIRVVSGAGLLLGLGAFLFAGLSLRRLSARAGGLVEVAQKLEAGDYSARAEVRGPRELRTLARALNAMSSRLEAEETRRRSVLADVAHELRTPLTIIRGQAEGIIDGVYEASVEHMAPIVSATTRLESLVDDLRTLALAETGNLRLQRERVDFALLTAEILDGFRGEADEAGVSVVNDVPPLTPAIDGDPVRLGSVLGNLIANALRHARRGGTVRVSAAASADGMVHVEVTDNGVGITPDLLPRVFDRFVRDPASPGSGIGLAIVRDIVEAHGGRVAARNNAEGGATFDVVLPAAH